MATLNNLTERAVAGVLWTSLSMGAQASLQLVALVVLARLVSPSEFGIFAAVLVVIGLSTVFSQLGVGPAIAQRPVLEERHLRTGFTLSLLFSAVLVVAIWMGAARIAAFFAMPELTNVVQIACLVFACQGISAVADAVAQRQLRFRWLASVDAIAFAAGFLGAGPVLAWLGFGVWALVGAYILQHLTRMLFLLFGQAHPKRPQLEWRAARELLYFGSGFTLARLCNYFAGQSDSLIVGRYLGAAALGLYSHAMQLMSAPAVLLGQLLDRVLFPTMALVQLQPARLARAYRGGTAICTLISLPLSVILSIVAPEVVLVLLGQAWVGVVPCFQVLALGMSLRANYKLSDAVARATGAVYRRAWRQAVFAATVIAGTIIGQYWGLAGVAIGVLAALVVNFALMTQLSLRLTGMKWAEIGAAHVPGIALGGILGPATWVLVEWLRTLHVSPMILLVDVALFAVVASLALCCGLPPLFVGKDVRALLPTLMSFVQQRLQSRPLG